MQLRPNLLASSLLIVIVGATALPAQTNAAMLYANGDVKVNGQSAGVATALFSGDKVDVSQSSAASINRSGSSVVINPNSSIQYDSASVQIISGSARISTSKGMFASAGQILVLPKESAAKFDIVRTSDKVVVVSREGALTVKDSDRTMLVQAGSNKELALGPTTSKDLVPGGGSNAAFATFISDHSLDHPYYGVNNSMGTSDSRLPLCADVDVCIRPRVSQIRPCCCPPIVKCD